MNTPEHTPGPWQVNERFDGHVMTSDGLAVADCCLDYSSIDFDEQKINARLIAAAPELLEALKEISEVFDVSWREGSTQRRLGDLARTAIAKATGETK